MKMSKFCGYNDGNYYHYGDVYENVVNKFYIGPEVKQKGKRSKNRKNDQWNITNNYYLNTSPSQHVINDFSQNSVHQIKFAELDSTEQQLPLVDLLKNEYSKIPFSSTLPFPFSLSKTDNLGDSIPNYTYCVRPVLYQASPNAYLQPERLPSPGRHSQQRSMKKNKSKVSTDSSHYSNMETSSSSYLNEPQYYYHEQRDSYSSGESQDEKEMDIFDLESGVDYQTSIGQQYSNQSTRYNTTGSNTSDSFFKTHTKERPKNLVDRIKEHRERQFQRKLYHQQLEQRLKVIRDYEQRKVDKYQNARQKQLQELASVQNMRQRQIQELLTVQNARQKLEQVRQKVRKSQVYFDLKTKEHKPPEYSEYPQTVQSVQQIQNHPKIQNIRKPVSMAEFASTAKPSTRNFTVAYDRYGNKYIGSPKNVRQMVPTYTGPTTKKPEENDAALKAPPSRRSFTAPGTARFYEHKKRMQYYSSIPEEQQQQISSSEEEPTRDRSKTAGNDVEDIFQTCSQNQSKDSINPKEPKEEHLNNVTDSTMSSQEGIRETRKRRSYLPIRIKLSKTQDKNESTSKVEDKPQPQEKPSDIESGSSFNADSPPPPSVRPPRGAVSPNTARSPSKRRRYRKKIKKEAKKKEKEDEEDVYLTSLTDQTSTETFGGNQGFMASKASASVTTQNKLSEELLLALAKRVEMKNAAKQAETNYNKEFQVLLAATEFTESQVNGFNKDSTVEIDFEIENSIRSKCSKESIPDLSGQPREILSEQTTSANKDNSNSENCSKRSRSVPETNKLLQYAVFPFTHDASLTETKTTTTSNAKVNLSKEKDLVGKRSGLGDEINPKPVTSRISSNKTMPEIQVPDVKRKSLIELIVETPNSKRKLSKRLVPTQSKKSASSTSSICSDHVNASSRAASDINMYPVKHSNSVKAQEAILKNVPHKASSINFRPTKFSSPLLATDNISRVQGDQLTKNNIKKFKRDLRNSRSTTTSSSKGSSSRSLVQSILYPFMYVFTLFRGLFSECIRYIFFM